MINVVSGKSAIVARRQNYEDQKGFSDRLLSCCRFVKLKCRMRNYDYSGPNLSSVRVDLVGANTTRNPTLPTPLVGGR